MESVIHCDINCCYASIEEQQDPSLRGKPVAVCGDPEARHGIILTANYPARKFGIKTAETIWQAKQKCPHLILKPMQPKLYSIYGDAFASICCDYTPFVQRAGLDEAYLRLTGTEHLFGSPEYVAHLIQYRTKKELGLPISVGVSYNKCFAKFGSDYRKPLGVSIITPDNYKEIVWPEPVGDLYYVGRATEAKLNSWGIKTIGELANTNVNSLINKLGVHGKMIWEYANGIDNGEITEAGWEPIEKSIGHGTTAPRDMITPEDIHITLDVLSSGVSRRLWRKGLKAKTVHVAIRGANLLGLTRQKQLPIPSFTAKAIHQAAFELIEANWRMGMPIRSIEVRCSNLLPIGYQQQSLFDVHQLDNAQQDLENAIYSLQERFGTFTVRHASALVDTRLSGLDLFSDDGHHAVSFIHTIPGGGAEC